LAPVFVGLYQINATVPTLSATGNIPLTFKLGGTPGAHALAIALQ